MLRISQPKIQWQSWPPQHTTSHVHMVLRCFTMTAVVANTADIRRLSNLRSKDDSTSDTAIRRNRKDALKTCSCDIRNNTTTSVYPAKVPEPSSFACPKTDARRDARPTGPHVDFYSTEDSDSPSTKRQHEPGWRAPSLPVDISITPSQPFPLPLCNTKCKLHLRRVSRARDDVRSFQPPT
jgi:hypothetical protein